MAATERVLGIRRTSFVQVDNLQTPSRAWWQTLMAVPQELTHSSLDLPRREILTSSSTTTLMRVLFVSTDLYSRDRNRLPLWVNIAAFSPPAQIVMLFRAHRGSRPVFPERCLTYQDPCAGRRFIGYKLSTTREGCTNQIHTPLLSCSIAIQSSQCRFGLPSTEIGAPLCQYKRHFVSWTKNGIYKSINLRKVSIRHSKLQLSGQWSNISITSLSFSCATFPIPTKRRRKRGPRRGANTIMRKASTQATKCSMSWASHPINRGCSSLRYPVGSARRACTRISLMPLKVRKMWNKNFPNSRAAQRKYFTRLRWLTRVESNRLRKFLFVMKYRGPGFYEKYMSEDPQIYDSEDKHLLRAYMADNRMARPRDV